jgi:hypothetical protein
MRNSYLTSIIALCQKQKNKLMYIDELKILFRKELGSEYTDKKWYKLIYHLKNKWYLRSLKKEIFCITHPDQQISEEELAEQYYWQILHNHAMQIAKKRYIGWIKALELHYWNTDIPEQILIINPVKQSIDTIIAWKLIHAKTYTHQKSNLFTQFYSCSEKKKIWKQTYMIACKELGLLESLFSYDQNSDRYTYEYIKKMLKKYEPNLDIIEHILQSWKHHTSVNRLLELIKITRPKLVDPLRQLIKKYSFLLSV